MSSLLQSVARRLLNRPRTPEAPPVPALDWFATMALSVDRNDPPPRRLIETALAAIRVTLDDVSLEDLLRRPDVPDWLGIWPGEHYRLLGGLIKTLQPRLVIEIGTDCGLSALAMRKYLPPGGRIVTFDLRPWRQVEETALRETDFSDDALEQRLEDLADPAVAMRNRDLLEKADFFFVDGPKDNFFEQRFVDNLRAMKIAGRPLMMFDDTRLKSMLRFWDQLPFPKLDLTSFGHWSGTGLVDWNG
jgi:predicted O-methyltransferase YrrM